MLYILFDIDSLPGSARLSGVQDLRILGEGDEISLRILGQILGLLHITCA